MKDKLFILSLLLTQFAVFAQDDDLPITDDPPLAPIDSWIPVFVVFALVYGIFYLKNKRNAVNNNIVPNK